MYSQCLSTLLTVFVINTASIIVYGQTCNWTLLANCTANLQNNYIPFMFPPSSLPAACSACDTTYTCAVSAGCPPTYASIGNATAGDIWLFEYASCSGLCTPSGQQAYTQYQPCIFSATFTPNATAFNYCQNQTTSIFNKYLLPNASFDNTSVCRIINDAISCYLYAIQNTCTGASIVNGAMTLMLNYQINVTLAAVGPMLSQLGCTINGKGDVVNWTIPLVSVTSNTYVIVGAVIGGFVLAVIVIVAVVLTCIKKRKGQNTQTSSAVSSPPDQPYAILYHMAPTPPTSRHDGPYMDIEGSATYDHPVSEISDTYARAASENYSNSYLHHASDISETYARVGMENSNYAQSTFDISDTDATAASESNSNYYHPLSDIPDIYGSTTQGRAALDHNSNSCSHSLSDNSDTCANSAISDTYAVDFMPNGINATNERTAGQKDDSAGCRSDIVVSTQHRQHAYINSRPNEGTPTSHEHTYVNSTSNEGTPNTDNKEYIGLNVLTRQSPVPSNFYEELHMYM